MTFDEIVAQVRVLLKRRFDLDDDCLEDLKAKLIKADRAVGRPRFASLRCTEIA